MNECLKIQSKVQEREREKIAAQLMIRCENQVKRNNKIIQCEFDLMQSEKSFGYENYS